MTLAIFSNRVQFIDFKSSVRDACYFPLLNAFSAFGANGVPQKILYGFDMTIAAAEREYWQEKKCAKNRRETMRV